MTVIVTNHKVTCAKVDTLVNTEIIKVKDTLQIYLEKFQHSLQLQHYMLNFFQMNFRGHKKAT